MNTTKTNRTNTVIQYRFSLVEILVAISIIAILLGLSGAGYTAVQRKIARTRTEATLNKIRVGLESFKSKYGYYPQQATVGPFNFYIVTLSTKTVSGVKTTTNADSYFEPKYSFALFTEASKIKNEDAIKVPLVSPQGELSATNTTVIPNITYNLKYDLYYIIDGWKSNIKLPSGVDYSDPAYPTYPTKNGPYILYMCPGLVNTSSYDLFSAGNDRKFIWVKRDLANLPNLDNDDPSNMVNVDNIWPQGLKQK